MGHQNTHLVNRRKNNAGSEYAKRGIDRIIKKIRGWRKRKIEEIKR
jgi:hypothetical protein